MVSLFGSLLVLGCTEPSKSSLELRAESLEREPPAPVPPPLPFATLPSSRVIPPGVAAERWASIHWLPPTTFELGEFSGQQAPMVEWLRNVPFEGNSDPACTRALDGIERALMIKEGTFEPGQLSSNVFIGTIDPADVMACTRLATAALGGTVERDGPVTIVRFGDTSLYMAWGWLGTSTVFVWNEGDRGALERMLTAEPDRLAQRPE